MLNTLTEASDMLKAWNDSATTQFDKTFVEPITHKIEAFEAALEALQKTAEEVDKTIHNLDFS
jgi:hypothetical protein